MKIYLMLIALIFISFMPATGQNEKDTAGMGGQRMSSGDLVAKPSFEGAAGKYHIKVFIMSEIKGMGSSEMEDVANRDKPGNPDYHVMVEVTEAETGKTVSGAAVKVIAVTPTEKSLEVDLQPMLDQYGGDLKLDEKGEYQFSVSVDADGEAASSLFKHIIK